MRQQIEKTINSEIIHRGKIVNLKVDRVELPNGNKSIREVVEHAGGVAIVAIDEQKNVLLVKQFRYPIKKELLEIPAGILRTGEEPLQAAKRELEEETGYRASFWQFLFSIYSSPGFTNEVLYLYLARNLESGRQCLDPDEFIQLIKLPFESALAMVVRGEICDAKSIAGLFGSTQVLGFINKT